MLLFINPLKMGDFDDKLYSHLFMTNLLIFISSNCFNKTEADASELLEHLEKVFLVYYMNSGTLSTG